MTESTNSIMSSGWSSVVLFLATAIPLFLFWKPLRNVINEYRLYKRCQQYPHIVVCKESTTTSGRKSDDGIVGQVLRIGIWLASSLFSVLQFLTGALITMVLSTTNKKEQETIEESPTLLSGSIETEEQTMSSSDSGSKVNLASDRSIHFSVSKDTSNIGTKIHRSQPAKQKIHRSQPAKLNSYMMRPSEDIFESSNQQTERINLPMQYGQRSMATAPFIQERKAGGIRRRRNTAQPQPSNHHLQSQMVATTSTQTTVTKPFVIDSSSLSEKMRKRRSNGEQIMGYNAITGEGDEGTSRKRRKLNVGRMPLQGCVSRHPRVGAWQTTRILDKREREERELLRSMSRKRVKPTVEPPKPAASATASTPAFSFGQTTAATTKQDAPAAAAATPAPAFQFGATAAAKPNESASGATDKKSEPAKTPAFSFGATTTSNATTNSDKAQALAASAPAPAAPFSFGSSTGGASGDTKAKDQPAKTPAFTFGSTPAAAPTAATPAAPAQAPPSFGTTGAASTNTTATSSAPAPSFGAPTAATPAAPAPTFGATPAAPAPAFGATPAAPAPAFGATPAAPAFGSTPAPAFG
eukprot:CAMPEP_0116138810 /NCGR_PEP_ID=MMETSP0329-20121206/12975_1 /TAXON_ID=697910 /ORGANISM="Pseudo-nitzschia arenysensis, Strain B593" /LENGTH=581 /DNA_ID=CAMNT_0003633807 /DNA_START=26 /DNA_END=1768 /DNA_ORIENTATION=+